MRIIVPDQPVGRLTDAWRHCVGTGRFELALRRDYQDSLALMQRDIGFRHIRGHGLLSDGVGIHRPYQHQGARRVHHAFTYVDQVIDAYLGAGRPALRGAGLHARPGWPPATRRCSGGRATSPRPARWPEWADLVRATVAHLVDRYGLDEVRGWPIEVWNEPNLTDFWQGADQDAYHRLYEVTAHAVKEVDAGLQVGGPAISPGADDWLERRSPTSSPHRDVPVDFVSRHAYTSGPAQHVPFGAHQTLAPASTLLEQFAAPREHLAGTALAGLPVHITEFNSSYRPDNPIHDTAFHAAYLAPVLARRRRPGRLVLVLDVQRHVRGGRGADRAVPRRLRPAHPPPDQEAHLPPVRVHGPHGRRGAGPRRGPPGHPASRRPGHRAGLGAGRRHRPCAGARRAPRAAVGAGRTRRAPRRRSCSRSSVSEEAGNAWAAWREMGRPPLARPRQLDALREAAEPARSPPRPAGRRRPGRPRPHPRPARGDPGRVSGGTDETPPWWDERPAARRSRRAHPAAGPG